MVGPEQLDQGEIEVRLQPVAIAAGQLRNSEGGPISGMAIEASVLPSVDFGPRLQTLASDAEGKFQMTLIPGCRYFLDRPGRGDFDGVTLADDIAIEAGESEGPGNAGDRQGWEGHAASGIGSGQSNRPEY